MNMVEVQEERLRIERLVLARDIIASNVGAEMPRSKEAS